MVEAARRGSNFDGRDGGAALRILQGLRAQRHPRGSRGARAPPLPLHRPSRLVTSSGFLHGGPMASLIHLVGFTVFHTTAAASFISSPNSSLSLSSR